GPAVHVVRYKAHKLDAVIDAVNATGYGLTLGVHTRVDATARYIASRVEAGNVYVNRNMIGAGVGGEPFGGGGLCGAGAEAGGRSLLPASIRDGANGDDQHRGSRRQREPADDGELAGTLRVVEIGVDAAVPFQLAPRCNLELQRVHRAGRQVVDLALRGDAV